MSLVARELTQYALIPSAVRQRLVLRSVSSLFTLSAFIIHSVFWKKSHVVCLFVSRKLVLIMSLFKYFKCCDPAHPKVLLQPDRPLATVMPSSSIVAVNKEVKTALDSSIEHDQGSENGQHLFLEEHGQPLHHYIATTPM